MADRHTYYLAHQKKVFGAEVEEKVAAFLFATYMRFLPPENEPGRMDGVSVWYEGEKEFIRVIVNNIIVHKVGG